MPDYSTKEKEKVIVAAARERFAHFGFTKVTMDEIAADVGIGKASIYYYFPTKENLFNSVIQQELNEFVQDIEQIILKEIKASQKLIEYVDKRLIYFQHLLNLGTLSIHSFLDVKSVYKKFFNDFEKKELLLLKRIIDEGIKNGEFRKNNYENIAAILLHILQGLRLRTLKRIKPQENNYKSVRDLQKEMNTVIKIFIRGISK